MIDITHKGRKGGGAVADKGIKITHQVVLVRKAALGGALLRSRRPGWGLLHARFLLYDFIFSHHYFFVYSPSR